MEAEHHAIWQNSEGRAIDPTPHDHRYREIAFLYDPTLSDLEIRDNHRLPLTDDPLVSEYLQIQALLRHPKAPSPLDNERIARRALGLYGRLVSRYGEEPSLAWS